MGSGTGGTGRSWRENSPGIENVGASCDIWLLSPLIALLYGLVELLRCNWPFFPKVFLTMIASFPFIIYSSQNIVLPYDSYAKRSNDQLLNSYFVLLSSIQQVTYSQHTNTSFDIENIANIWFALYLFSCFLLESFNCLRLPDFILVPMLKILSSLPLASLTPLVMWSCFLALYSSCSWAHICVFMWALSPQYKKFTFHFLFSLHG